MAIGSAVLKAPIAINSLSSITPAASTGFVERGKNFVSLSNNLLANGRLALPLLNSGSGI